MHSTKRGFTLIELLVVIAIIAILAAILFPVFAQAKEAAKKTGCLSNFNGVAKAMHIYLGDYDDTFPLVNYLPCSATYCSGTVMSPVVQSNWILDMQPYIQNIRYTRCPSDPNATDQGLDLDPISNAPSGGNQRLKYFNWTTRANHGLNSQYLAPMYRWTTTQWNGTIDAPMAIKHSRIGNSSEMLAILDSIWDRAATTGAPLDGGNWALDPPCRLYDPSTGIAAPGYESLPYYGQTSGVAGIWWFGGWNPTSQTAWNIFGGAFPYHGGNKAAGQNTWARRNEGIVATAFVDGHSKALRIDAITAGCNVLNGWAGRIFAPEFYLWDLR